MQVCGQATMNSYILTVFHVHSRKAEILLKGIVIINPEYTLESAGGMKGTLKNLFV